LNLKVGRTYLIDSKYYRYWGLGVDSGWDTQYLVFKCIEMEDALVGSDTTPWLIVDRWYIAGDDLYSNTVITDPVTREGSFKYEL
jgi:hypothetical protein